MTSSHSDSTCSDYEVTSKAMSRRQFLASVGAAGLAAAGFATGGRATAKAKAMEPATQAPGVVAMTLAAFEAAVGTRYTLKTPDGPRTIILRRVKDNGSSDKLEQFTVVFELLDSNGEVSQDVYELARTGAGDKLSLLLSPGEKAGVLTAAFCQLKS